MATSKSNGVGIPVEHGLPDGPGTGRYPPAVPSTTKVYPRAAVSRAGRVTGFVGMAGRRYGARAAVVKTAGGQVPRPWPHPPPPRGPQGRALGQIAHIADAPGETGPRRPTAPANMKKSITQTPRGPEFSYSRVQVFICHLLFSSVLPLSFLFLFPNITAPRIPKQGDGGTTDS